MKFIVRNLGIIKEADIELKGLTVLTGLNDTGKSFLTKSIFSVIKTINESNTQLKIEQFEQIQATLTQIYQLVRPLIPLTPANQNLLFPANITNQIAAIFSQSNVPGDNNFILQLLNNYKAGITGLLNPSQPAPNPTQATQLRVASTNVDNLFRVLISKFNQASNEEENCKSYFDKVIVKKFFQAQVSPSGLNIPTSIRIVENDNELLNIAISANVVQSFKLNDIINFKEATLIETPTILQLAKFINTTLVLQGSPFNRRMVQQRAELPYHIYDLIEKLYLSTPVSTNERFTEIYNRISSIISGKVIFEPSELNFSYVKSNSNQKIKPFNIATGIKSFGIIQLLLNSGAISPNSILIVDEPEVHEHPKWEVEYAKIIVELSRNGIPIIVSSHSPYFIEALARFQDANITRFYYGEKDEAGYSKFEDVSRNLNPIFKKLAEPFQNLAFQSSENV